MSKFRRKKGAPPVVNKSRKGFGRQKEEQQAESPQLFSGFGPASEGLMFALDFIDRYAVS